MANVLKIKRGTRAQLNAAITGNTLNLGEPYLITDENRIAIGTGSNSYEVFAKSSEVAGVLDGDLTAIAGLTGTGFLKRTGTDTWVLDTSTYLTTASASSTYQPVDADLTAIAALSGTSGILKKTAADTWTLDTSAYLTANQSISVTGDATGTGTTAIGLTLATVNSNVGTFTKVTVNAKGLVTAATTLAATDIPTLTAAKISDFDTQVRTSRLDQMATPTASVAMGSQKITGLAEPTLAQDAATKNYVDTVAQGLDTKLSVRAATTANITLSGTQTIDGVTLIANDRVLVKNQTTNTQNGIYVVAAGAWSRAADADTTPDLVSAFTFVEEGTVNADTGWVSTFNPGDSIGSSPVIFTQFSAAGAYTAGTGMTATGNTFNVIGTADRITANANDIDIASTYVGQTSITTLGSITTGTWNATTIAVNRGGTGVATLTGLVKGNGTSAFSAAVADTDYLDPNSTIDGGTF